MKEEKRESRWKGIIMLVLGFIFMLPVLLIVMNSFKTGKEILTNFVSFPTIRRRCLCTDPPLWETHWHAP